ncbi:myxococcus cysteine-rich repeat containing protein [Pseudenhygromyxa sp. WMMC2535]|uniref:myxococcus cysteine-rich repeat containing protein n=1 Tax=Pseudenhygromyxa sp. WMMC2535 TaxID=2712867 RepID=UPI0020D076A3|nr:myxococcus cysteine-rich repeat containing protein [Pseudenhygromyxa sp. WMMC2535]
MLQGCSDDPGMEEQSSASDSDEPICGNAVVEGDETCDDGNLVSGDGCSATCQLPGALVECVTLLEGAGTGSDGTQSLLSMDDGSFIAAGAITASTPPLQDAWIGHFEATGSPRWLLHPSSENIDAATILALAIDETDANTWAIASKYGGKQLIHIDGSGTLEHDWSLPDLSDPPDEDLNVTALANTDTALWMAGSKGGVWMGRFDTKTQQLSTSFNEAPATYPARATALAYGGDSLGLLAVIETSPSSEGDQSFEPSSKLLFVEFDLDGEEIFRTELGDEGESVATHAQGLVPDGAGGWLIGGTQWVEEVPPFSYPRNALVVRVHPSEGWEWRSDQDNRVILDLARSTRGVIALGYTIVDGSEQGWMVGLDLEGAPLWERQHATTGYEHTRYEAASWDSSERLRLSSSTRTTSEKASVASCLTDVE